MRTKISTKNDSVPFVISLKESMFPPDSCSGRAQQKAAQMRSLTQFIFTEYQLHRKCCVCWGIEHSHILQGTHFQAEENTQASYWTKGHLHISLWTKGHLNQALNHGQLWVGRHSWNRE